MLKFCARPVNSESDAYSNKFITTGRPRDNLCPFADAVRFFSLLCLSFVPRYPSSSLSFRRSPCCRLHTDRLPSLPTPQKRAPRHLSPHTTPRHARHAQRFASQTLARDHTCAGHASYCINSKLTRQASSKAEELEESVHSFTLSPAPLSRSWASGIVLPVFNLTPSRVLGSLGTRP